MADKDEPNLVKLKVNGKIFDGWISGSVERSLNAASGSFSLTYVDSWAGQDSRWQIKSGDECVLVYNDTPIITGYVEKVGVKYDSTSRTLTVSGRDKTGDLVDTSAQQPAKSFKGVTLTEMANKLAGPFGVNVVAKSPAASQVIKLASTQIGGTAWEVIDKLARYQGVLAYPDGKGGLVFDDVSSSVTYNFVEGEDILGINYETDTTELFNKYVVSITIGGPNDKHRVEVAEAIDNSVKRPRVKEVVINKQGTKADALARAKWELGAATAKALKLTITVRTWGDKLPFEINKLVSIKAPMAGISGSFLLESVKFNIDSRLTADINLVLADAYKPQPNRSKESLGDGGDV